MQSLKGLTMLESISPIYESYSLEQSIYEAIGEEFDNIEDKSLEETILQFFPQTATWGLVYWEKRLGLPTNLSEDISIRRKKVLIKLQTKWPITPKTMASIINTYTNADVLIDENVAPYTFAVIMTSQNGFPNSLSDLYKTVKSIKPSHMAVQYKLISIVNTKMYYAAAMVSGETVTVYPWQTRKIETRGNIDVAMASVRNSEITSVYPRKEA